MPWNPEIYNQFKNIRYQPFFDLMGLISEENLIDAVDVGCGTGEQTKILSKKFENTKFLGIDSSSEMLSNSKEFENEKLRFQQKTIEDFVEDKTKWNLIFSNAALQFIKIWLSQHTED